MLKIALLWIAVCVGSVLFAQETVTLECRIAEGLRLNTGNQIKLYKVEKGDMVEKATGSYTGEGYFGFRFVPEYEGFYVVGEEQNYYYPVWVKAGEHVSIRIDREGAHLVGKKNSPENEVLYKWLELSREVCNMSTRNFMSREVTFQEFFRKLEEFIPEADRFKAEIRTKNQVFDGLMKRSVEYEKDYYALNYLFTPKLVGYTWPEKTDYSPYFATILSSEKWKDEEVLRLPFGFRLLSEYVNFAGKMSEGEEAALEQWIPNRRLRAELVLASLGHVRSVFQFERELRKNEGLFTTEEQQRAEDMLGVIRKANARQKAVDFTYPDVTGKMVSLSDFKGKVVLVDVWATWCGPCRRELPHLKRLEEKMEETDLVVIGVSVDEKKNYEKWKGMVLNGEVKGVQLFADGFGKIAKDYQVTGIPRFIVFDREGKVVEANAPRPSSPDLEELLNSLLKQ